MPYDPVTEPPLTGPHVFLVPLKSFDVAKDRLRRAGARGVTDLAERLADAVIANCAPRPVVVVCETDDVEDFARRRGARVVRAPRSGLNAAVAYAYDYLGAAVARVTIVHGDLRQPHGLGVFESRSDVTVVTDHHGDGTNVLSLPAGLPFGFRYGPSSASAHVLEAKRLDLSCDVVRGSPWRFDVDEADDLIANETDGGPSAPHQSHHPS